LALPVEDGKVQAVMPLPDGFPLPQARHFPDPQARARRLQMALTESPAE